MYCKMYLVQQWIIWAVSIGLMTFGLGLKRIEISLSSFKNSVERVLKGSYSSNDLGVHDMDDAIRPGLSVPVLRTVRFAACSWTVRCDQEAFRRCSALSGINLTTS